MVLAPGIYARTGAAGSLETNFQVSSLHFVRLGNDPEAVPA